MHGATAVYRLGSGYQPEIVSPAWVNRALPPAGSGSNIAWAFSFGFNGHQFYVLKQKLGPALVYDALTGQWFLWIKSDGSQTVLEWNCATFVPSTLLSSNINGKTLIGDANGYVAPLNFSGVDIATNIFRSRVLTHLSDKQEFMRIRRFELLGENDNISRTVSLRTSRDGGLTFSTTSSITNACTGRSRYVWSKLGAARNWALSLESTSANQSVWISAWIDEGAADG
jgi:hypothetical protein